MGFRGLDVFVTGASGLLGYAIARALLLEGASVRALCRGRGLPGDLEALGAALVKGDLDDRAALARGIDGAAYVFHVAADVRMWRGAWADLVQTNVIGTRNVVGAALAARPVRLVFTSSASTLGRPIDATRGAPVLIDERCAYNLAPLGMVYPHTKWLAEEEVRRGVREGLDAVITHPAAILGPWDWKLHALPLFEAPHRVTGVAVPRGYRTLCDVRDVAAGHLAAAERGRRGEGYALGGHPMPVRDLFAIIAREVSGRAPLFTLPAPAARAIGRVADAAGVLTGKAPLFGEEMAIQSTLRVMVSSDKAARELGYACRSADESVRDAVAWYREQGALAGAP